MPTCTVFFLSTLNNIPSQICHPYVQEFLISPPPYVQEFIAHPFGCNPSSFKGHKMKYISRFMKTQSYLSSYRPTKSKHDNPRHRETCGYSRTTNLHMYNQHPLLTNYCPYVHLCLSCTCFLPRSCTTLLIGLHMYNCSNVVRFMKIQSYSSSYRPTKSKYDNPRHWEA